ncbi:nucleoplasmin-2b isoform X3 [Electrophorus electricus]|nr:nucleoplasmin-2b isoform X3 [Electrophorus electricus]
MNKTEKPVSSLWGCELTESNKEESFKADDTNHQHQLALRTMCLGHTAKDEFNIIELVTGEGKARAKAVPIATLHAKSMPTVSELELTSHLFHYHTNSESPVSIDICQVNLSGLDLHPPVTFRLKHGSGPVYVGAEHVALEDYSDEEEGEEEMDEEVEEEEEDIEESPVKKVTKNGASKRKKPEKGDDEGDASEGENNPPKKGKGRGRKPVSARV